MENATILLIKWLKIVNFKGARNQTITFDTIITNIFGDNATGKTTISDALHWLFFGKDSIDRKDFDLKNTVDTSLNRQDHEVSAAIIVNDSEIVIKRIFREKWVKKKGAEEAVFSGNETVYYWDEVPVSQGEFAKKISAIVDEKIFKLISNPGYFNAMKWQDRRQILFNIAGNVSNEEVAGDNKKFLEIISQLNNGKTLEEYKKQVASKRKKIKDELDQVPTRIDEVNKGIPTMADPSLIRREIETKAAKIVFLDGQMADRSNSMKSAFEVVREHQQRIFSVQSEMDAISNLYKQQLQSAEQDVKGERDQITRDISSKESELEQIVSQRDRRQIEVDSIKKQIIEKRALWTKTNAERESASSEKLEFDDHYDSCPTCKRLFDADDIASKKDELLENFNTNKTKKVAEYTEQLSQIVSQAKALQAEDDRLSSLDTSSEIIEIQNEIDLLKSRLEDSGSPLLTIDEQLKGHEAYQELFSKLETLKATAPEEPKVDTTDLQHEKTALEDEVRKLNEELAQEVVIKQSKLRVSELETKEKQLAGELAQLEGQEFTIEAFTRKKVEEVENRINGLFKYVKFKMFDTQINGGETETCETMLEGVPWSVLNNAGRINAGLDIINAISIYYNINAPVFIDNAESITKLIEVKSQTVRLVVSPFSLLNEGKPSYTPEFQREFEESGMSLDEFISIKLEELSAQQKTA